MGRPSGHIRLTNGCSVFWNHKTRCLSVFSAKNKPLKLFGNDSQVYIPWIKSDTDFLDLVLLITNLTGLKIKEIVKTVSGDKRVLFK